MPYVPDLPEPDTTLQKMNPGVFLHVSAGDSELKFKLPHAVPKAPPPTDEDAGESLRFCNLFQHIREASKGAGATNLLISQLELAAPMCFVHFKDPHVRAAGKKKKQRRASPSSSPS